jgi:hypothetical protein
MGREIVHGPLPPFDGGGGGPSNRSELSKGAGRWERLSSTGLNPEDGGNDILGAAASSRVWNRYSVLVRGWCRVSRNRGSSSNILAIMKDRFRPFGGILSAKHVEGLDRESRDWSGLGRPGLPPDGLD